MDNRIMNTMNNQDKPKVDEWNPIPFDPSINPLVQEEIFQTCKDYIIAPMTYILYSPEQIPEMYQDGAVIGNAFDCFFTSSKKCYNNANKIRFVRYLNYFERYYDQDREYLSILAKLKLSVDTGMYCATGPKGNTIWLQEQFINDLSRYILSDTIVHKVEHMVNDNYILSLNHYKNSKNPALEYDNEHAKICYILSILQDLFIPIMTHFGKKAKILNSDFDKFALKAYDRIVYYYGDETDIYAKLIETSSTTTEQSEKRNSALWKKQNIRGTNPSMHSKFSVDNILLNISPKYEFNRKIISLNHTSIKRNTGFKVIDIQYEYNFVPLSSSKRDEDNNSDFDRYEANMTKQSQSKYLQVKMNSHYTVEQIENMYGPFSNEEIEYYRNHLSGQNNINEFQKNLVSLMFYRYFQDTISCFDINNRVYIELILAAKRILEGNGLFMLSQIISSRVGRIVSRKSLNKKEKSLFYSDPLYEEVKRHYISERPLQRELSIVGTILSSEFTEINFENQEFTGRDIPKIPEIIIPEMHQFTLMNL